MEEGSHHHSRLEGIEGPPPTNAGKSVITNDEIVQRILAYCTPAVLHALVLVSPTTYILAVRVKYRRIWLDPAGDMRPLAIAPALKARRIFDKHVCLGHIRTINLQYHLEAECGFSGGSLKAWFPRLRVLRIGYHSEPRFVRWGRPEHIVNGQCPLMRSFDFAKVIMRDPMITYVQSQQYWTTGLVTGSIDTLVYVCGIHTRSIEKVLYNSSTISPQVIALGSEMIKRMAQMLPPVRVFKLVVDSWTPRVSITNTSDGNHQVRDTIPTASIEVLLRSACGVKATEIVLVGLDQVNNHSDAIYPETAITFGWPRASGYIQRFVAGQLVGKSDTVVRFQKLKEYVDDCQGRAEEMEERDELAFEALLPVTA